MAELPKIVKRRLSQAPGTVEHPDTNLLAGLVEHSLSARERSAVLGHLTQCAECRDLLSVALPQSEGNVAAPATTRRWPGWLRWPVLRWGVLAASLVIMGTVALVRQPPTRRTELASRVPSAPSITAPLPSDVTISAAPGKARRSERELPQKTPSLEGKSASTELPPGLESAQRRDDALKGPKSEVQAYRAASSSKAHTAARLPANAFRANPSLTNAAGSDRPSTSIMAQVCPVPPPAAAKAIQPPPQPAPRALELAPSAPPEAEASRASEEEKGKTVEGLVGGVTGGALQEPAPETASQKLTDNLTASAEPRRATLGKSMHAAAPAVGISARIASPMTADWSISPAGRVQRSRDGRKTWEELDVDKNVVFRAVFAAGPDIWLGGTNGALYHSTDGGQHWTPVRVTSGSTTVTADIIRIEFKDAQHGAVKTSARQTWITSDAGQHWERQ